ncbi:MAG: hypothetical protein MJZ21_03830 [archaeon]|nr:hypothetical protein [archaeon]
MSAYVIYYLGSYKPFHDGNEDTAKRVSDMILADCGLVIPRTPSTNYFYNGACGKAYAIEEIVDWEKAHAERIVR